MTLFRQCIAYRKIAGTARASLTRIAVGRDLGHPRALPRTMGAEPNRMGWLAPARWTAAAGLQALHHAWRPCKACQCALTNLEWCAVRTGSLAVSRQAVGGAIHGS